MYTIYTMIFNVKNQGSISKELYNKIIELLPNGRETILELGSGEGTREILKAGYTIYSVEQNEKWVGQFPPAIYIYAPIKNEWFDTERMKDKLPKEYDLLLVNAPVACNPSIAKRRLGLLDNINLFKNLKNKIIIIDDTNRKYEKQLAEELSKKFDKNVEYFKDSWGKEFGVLK